MNCVSSLPGSEQKKRFGWFSATYYKALKAAVKFRSAFNNQNGLKLLLGYDAINRFQNRRGVRGIKHLRETSVSTILSKLTIPKQQFTTFQTAYVLHVLPHELSWKPSTSNNFQPDACSKYNTSPVFLSSRTGTSGLQGWALWPVAWPHPQLYQVARGLEPLLPQLRPRCLYPKLKQELGLSPADWDQTVPGQAMPDSAARAPKTAAGQWKDESVSQRAFISSSHSPGDQTFKNMNTPFLFLSCHYAPFWQLYGLTLNYMEFKNIISPILYKLINKSYTNSVKYCI